MSSPWQAEHFAAGTRGKHGYTPWAVGPDSVGWLIAGASQQAAPRFLAALRRMPPLDDGTVAGFAHSVYSRSPWRAGNFAAQHQLAFHGAQLDDLLARPAVRAVYVANQPAHHAATVLAALRAGKHVLCEPPLALSLEQALYLHHTAADRGLLLALNYQQRFDPALIAMRALLAGNELGELAALHIYQLEGLPPAQQTWRVAPAGGGLLFERTLRTIDTARFVSGDEVQALQAAAGPPAHSGDVVDDLHALLVLRRGRAIVHLHDSWNMGRAPSRIEAACTAGSALLVDWNSERTSRLFIERTGFGTRAAWGDAAARTPAQPQPLPEVDLWQLSLLAVHAALRTGNPPPTPAVDDIAALDVALALRTALQGGATAWPQLAGAAPSGSAQAASGQAGSAQAGGAPAVTPAPPPALD